MYKPKKIFVIIGHGTSDIGKGWLSSSIGLNNPENTLPIKIDPFFNLNFPKKIGKSIDKLCLKKDILEFSKGKINFDSKEYIISDDFIQYKDVGMKILPECNILGGNIIKEFIENSENINHKRDKKTFSDISEFLANKITMIVKKEEPEVVIIEVGGTVNDNENIYIPGALRLLESKKMLNIKPELLLLTYFDYSEIDDHKLNKIKTRYIQEGIRSIQKRFFGLPLKKCLVRRRYIPLTISNKDLTNQFKKISYETQYKLKNIELLPEVNWSDISKVTKFLKKRKVL